MGPLSLVSRSRRRLQGDGTSFGDKASLALRPFDIVLLEVVPHGQSPSLNRSFPSVPIPVRFAESSRTLDMSVTKNGPPAELDSTAPWTVLAAHRGNRLPAAPP